MNLFVSAEIGRGSWWKGHKLVRIKVKKITLTETNKQMPEMLGSYRKLIYKVVDFYLGEKQILFCKFSLDCFDVQVSYIILVCKWRRQHYLERPSEWDSFLALTLIMMHVRDDVDVVIHSTSTTAHALVKPLSKSLLVPHKAVSCHCHPR